MSEKKKGKVLHVEKLIIYTDEVDIVQKRRDDHKDHKPDEKDEHDHHDDHVQDHHDDHVQDHHDDDDRSERRDPWGFFWGSQGRRED